MRGVSTVVIGGAIRAVGSTVGNIGSNQSRRIKLVKYLAKGDHVRQQYG